MGCEHSSYTPRLGVMSINVHDSQVYSLHPDTGEIYAHMGRDFVVGDSNVFN